MEHQIALNKAKIALMQRPDSAFFTTVCFSLKHVWNPEIPTARTNGLTIEFSPAFFMSLTPDERLFLLLHETMHVAFLHMERLGQFLPKKWNIAADHVINLMLIARGYIMPRGGLADPQYADMSTEQVYHLLPDPPEDESFEMDLQTPPIPLDEFHSEMQDILVRAAVQAQMSGDSPGSIPGEIQIFLDKLLKPKLPWQRILQKFLFALNKNDYTFKVPNRRFFPKYHLPSMRSENLMELAIAVDTSGSVTDHDFLVLVTEVDCILRMMKPETITVIQFDTQIKSIDKVKTVRDLAQIKFTGRGGTNITQVMEWAKEHQPQLLLMFTDGYFHFAEQHKIKSPLMWLIHNHAKFTAPFGKVVHYKI